MALIRGMMMALDKAIKSRKEHRKPYRGEKAVDGTCRNNGGCPWCEENRRHKFRDKQADELKEWREGDIDGRSDQPESGA